MPGAQGTRGHMPHIWDRPAMVGKIKPKTRWQEREGEQAHSPGRVKRNFNSFYDPGVWKCDRIQEDTGIGKTGEKGGWEAANVAMLLLCQVYSTLWKTRTCPLSTQSSVQLPFGRSSHIRTSVPCLGRGVSWELELRNMQTWDHLWYALGKWAESLVKYTARVSVCHSWIFHGHMCPHRLECGMLGVLNKMHFSLVHLTENVRCRSMDVTVKNKKKENKTWPLLNAR